MKIKAYISREVIFFILQVLWTILQSALLTWKLSGRVEWSWWVVFSPFWVPILGALIARLTIKTRTT